MATLRFANRTGQAGVYHTGSPNYVACSGGAAEAGYVTFEAKDTDDSWDDGDTIGVLVLKDNSNYKVWIASWDATNKYLEVVTEEETVGTISDSDAVIARAVLTTEQIDNAITEPQINVQTGTTYTLLASDKGKVVCFTSGSAVTVTIDAALQVNFHCLLVQEGAGVVSLDPQSTDTLNGAAANVSLADQWKSGYLYQRTEGAWVLIV